MAESYFKNTRLTTSKRKTIIKVIIILFDILMTLFLYAKYTYANSRPIIAARLNAKMITILLRMKIIPYIFRKILLEDFMP